MMQITAPGIYTDFPTEDYFADPCPEPSFSQSIGKVLLAQSQAHAQVEHPRLAAPTDTDDEAEKYIKARAIGDAAHLLMLGRGKRLAVGQWDDWKKKEAREFRDDASAGGLTPILEKHFATASEMVEVGRKLLAENGIGGIFGDDGAAEVVIAWQQDGLWCRSMIDWLAHDCAIVADYKSTGLSVAPAALDKLMADAGWPVQGAMHESGLNVLHPENAGRRRHIFVAQEQYPPYELTVSVLPESTMTWGRKLLDRAWQRWRQAMASGQWRGYPRIVQHPQYPEWMERRMAEADAEQWQQTTALPSEDHMFAG